MKKFSLIISTLLLAFCIQAKTVYVATDGNNANDGTTWEKAVKDLATAYSKATAGDQIWMAGGVYAFTATINMIDAVNVYGGFEKGATSIDTRVQPSAAEPWKFANETVLTIDMTANFRPIDRVDKDTPWKGAIIDGIVLKDIETDNGRIAYMNDGVTLQNCAFINCSSTNTNIYFERNCVARNCLFEGNYNQTGKAAAALQLRGSKAVEKGNTVDNCVFRNNKCESLSLYNTTERDPGNTEDKHTVTNSIFTNNKDICIKLNEQSGRGIDIYNCIFEGNEGVTAAATAAQGLIITGGATGICNISNCIIRNNHNKVAADADWKNAVISLHSTTVKLMNSLITNNTCAQLTIYASGEIYNSTIANNNGSIFGVGYATFMNNAIIGNQATEGKKIFAMDSESNCYLVNNAINNLSDIAEGGVGTDIFGTIVADASSFKKPVSFIGIAADDNQKAEIVNSDYSLTTGSVCINAGDMEELPLFIGDAYNTLFQKDLAGNTRVVGGKINIGAFQGDSNTAIDQAYNDNLTIIGVKGGISVEMTSNASVAVYNIAGTLVNQQELSEGNNHITISNTGIYLVKIGNRTYKVAVR